MAEISIDKSDLKRLNSMLGGLTEMVSAKGRTELLEEKVYPYARRRIGLRFGDGGDDVSGPWAPLKPATIRYREEEIKKYGFRIGPSEPINIRSFMMFSHLMRSHSVRTSSDVSALSIPGTLKGNPSAYSVETMQRKLRIAQQGDPKRNIPARPVLGLNQKDEKDIHELTINWILEGLRAKSK
jgi:hypothetical protein